MTEFIKRTGLLNPVDDLIVHLEKNGMDNEETAKHLIASLHRVLTIYWVLGITMGLLVALLMFNLVRMGLLP